MSQPVTFIDLTSEIQSLILGKVGRWLNYTEIKYLVGSFNIHNRSSSPCKITSLAMLNTLQFIDNVILIGDPEWKESYLRDRFLEVVKTTDLQVSHGLSSKPFVVECLRTLSQTQFTKGLSHATGRGHVQAVCILLQISFPISVHTRGLWVFRAASKGYVQIIRELLKNKAVIENDMRGTALGIAAARGCLKAVKLLDNGEITEDLRGSAVMNAAEGGHIDIIRVLLRNGTIVEDNRDMAKKLAVRKGHHQVVKALSKLYSNI